MTALSLQRNPFRYLGVLTCLVGCGKVVGPTFPRQAQEAQDRGSTQAAAVPSGTSPGDIEGASPGDDTSPDDAGGASHGDDTSPDEAGGASLAGGVVASSGHSETAAFNDVREVAPWKLDVSMLPTVELQNVSQTEQLVLPDSLIQPARLRVFDAQGREILPRDRREIMKYDNRVRRASYIALDPGRSMACSSVTVFAAGADSQVTHGPFVFSVHAGETYSAYIEWTSARRDYAEESGERGQLDDVWLGTVTSDSFELKIE